MSKKLHSKLLSVILVIAICCAALCGSLVSANAATADYSGTYTITVGDEKNAVPFGANTVTATVTFDLPAGFASGEFTVTSDTSKYKGVSNLRIIDGTVASIYDGVSFSADNFESCELNGYTASFADLDSYLYTSLTLQYDYTIATYVSNGTGNSYPAAITVNESAFGIDSDYINASFVAAEGSDTSFHSHGAWTGITADDVNTTKGDKQHTEIDAVCTCCKSANSDTSYCKYPQIIPDYTEFADDLALDTNKSSFVADGNMGIIGATVDYRDDGTLDVNVHTYTQHNFTSLILVCDENGKELFRTSTTPDGESRYSEDGFVSGIKYYTLSGLSARDVDTPLYLTMVGCWNNSGAKTLAYSRTVTFTLADYCVNVIEGNAVWTDDATDEQIKADKDVAAALCYYSAAIDESVFEHITANNGTLSGNTAATLAVEKVTDRWEYRTELSTSNLGYGFYQTDFTAEYPELDSSTYGTESNPYLVENAEQLAYLALGNKTAEGNLETSGMYFKVKDGIGAFYMSPGIDGTESVDEVKQYKNGITKNSNGAYYDVDNRRVVYWEHSDSNRAFDGHFDGNGVTIYGIVSSGELNSGLFPLVDGDFSVKNVTVANSYISAKTVVGAIVGQIYTADKAMSFENCTVTNNYLETTQTDAHSWNNAPAGICGGGQTPSSLKIDNCLVYGNTMFSGNDNNCVAFISYLSLADEQCKSGNYLISNSVAIDYAPWVGNAGYYVRTSNNIYKNLHTNIAKNDDWKSTVSSAVDNTCIQSYTDATNMQGANALTTMSLDTAVWFATDSYPVLRAFHNIKTVSTGTADGHTEQCVDKLDGTPCAVHSPTVTPHDLTVEKTVDGVSYTTCSDCGWGRKNVGTTITPVEKKTVTWNTNVSITTNEQFLASVTGSGTESDPYIIDDPNELVYLIHYAGSDSAGRYYKIDDGIGAFDLTGYGIAETAANIKSTLSDKISSWNKWWYNGNDYPFQGNFDGNGVVIFGAYGQGWFSGLFPKVSGTVTIKNLTVKASGFKSSGNAGVGAIVGCCGASSLSIENCAVENCYLTSVDSKGPIGIMVGCLNNNAPLIIKNCFVKDNICDESTTYPYGGVTSGANYSNSTSYQYSNIIAIGNTPFATLPDSTEYNSANVNNAANYTNVYTDQTVDSTIYGTNINQLTTDQLIGANALATMSLDTAVWFATDSYPQLRVFHNLVTQYCDDYTHKLVCADSLDGVMCTVCGVATDHADSGNMTCECGYEIQLDLDTLELIRNKYSDKADAIIGILQGAEQETTLFESAFATNALFKAAYPADSSAVNGTIDDCCYYATSLNLKTTPHIAFTFAFSGQYRENKQNITATFTCGEYTQTVSATEMTNNEGAGRYHLYRLKDMPVINLCKPIDVTVTYDGTNMVSGTYSAAGYAINAIDLGAKYGWHSEAAKALVYYSEMLAARYGA